MRVTCMPHDGEGVTSTLRGVRLVCTAPCSCRCDVFPEFVRGDGKEGYAAELELRRRGELYLSLPTPTPLEADTCSEEPLSGRGAERTRDSRGVERICAAVRPSQLLPLARNAEDDVEAPSADDEDEIGADGETAAEEAVPATTPEAERRAPLPAATRVTGEGDTARGEATTPEAERRAALATPVEGEE